MNWNGKTLNTDCATVQAQFSPVYGILVDDFDKDGMKDILMGGNLYNANLKREFTMRAMASYLKEMEKEGLTSIVRQQNQACRLRVKLDPSKK